MNPFRSFFAAPTRPILLRLDLGGAPCPASVEVEAEWLPAGIRTSAPFLSESSMLLLPWRADADEAVLSVRVGARVGHASVTREANRDGPVLDLALDDPSRLNDPRQERDR